jgi:hypothetical protein
VKGARFPWDGNMRLYLARFDYIYNILIFSFERETQKKRGKLYYKLNTSNKLEAQISQKVSKKLKNSKKRKTSVC